MMTPTQTELRAFFKRQLAMDEEWITVHPNGKEHEGQHVLLEGDVVKAGMGGKFNGKKISEISTKSSGGGSKETSAPKNVGKNITSQILNDFDSLRKEYENYYDSLSQYDKENVYTDSFYGIPSQEEQEKFTKSVLEKVKDFKPTSEEVVAPTLLPSRDRWNTDDWEDYNKLDSIGNKFTKYEDGEFGYYWSRRGDLGYSGFQFTDEQNEELKRLARKVVEAQKMYKELEKVSKELATTEKQQNMISEFFLHYQNIYTLARQRYYDEGVKAEKEFAKKYKEFINDGGTVGADGTDRKGTFIDGAGEYVLYRAADPQFPLESGTNAVYFASTRDQAKKYETRGIEAKKDYKSNKETHSYKVKLENPLIIHEAGINDFNSLEKRWDVLFPNEPFPRTKEGYEWWRRMDRKCEKRAKELGYDSIVTTGPNFREVAVLGKKLKNNKAIQNDYSLLFA